MQVLRFISEDLHNSCAHSNYELNVCIEIAIRQSLEAEHKSEHTVKPTLDIHHFGVSYQPIGCVQHSLLCHKNNQ